MVRRRRHPRATTTEAVRRQIKESALSVRAAAKQFGVNPKTILKWRARADVLDAPSVRRERSVVLSKEEETMLVGFRTLTRLPLDDCLYAMKVTIPHLTRSSLHRCLQHYGVSRLSETRPRSTKLAMQAIGHFAVDMVESFTDEGKYYYFVGIDMASRVFFGRLCRGASQRSAAQFVNALIAFTPYKIHTISTANLHPFVDALREGGGLKMREAPHNLFDAVCARHGIIHLSNAPPSPFGANPQHRLESPVARLRDREFKYGSYKNLRQITQDFILDYNFKKRLKSLRGLTPFEFVCHAWSRYPDLFRREPRQFHSEVESSGIGW